MYDAPCCTDVGRENLSPPSPDARVDFNNRRTGLQAPERQRFLGMAIGVTRAVLKLPPGTVNRSRERGVRRVCSSLT